MQLIDQILDITFLGATRLSQQSRALARLSLFDWFVCGLGGRQEPVSLAVQKFIEQHHAGGEVPVFGGARAAPLPAALANGTISHALDYDDTHFAHIGHLSVGIYPAAVAAGDHLDKSLDEVVDAFLVGAECAVRIGMALGTEHYERGFHQTATAGAFGATVAVARLFGLSRPQCRAAFGLCATRASGLKNQFGTMGKPLNAGYAASNGIECASLAALGVTTATDGLHGFFETHSENSAAPITGNDQQKFQFNDIRYKLHACCHGTHAMIEAILQIRLQHDFSVEDIQQVRVSVHPKWLQVCDIKTPATGLEIKFSYRWLAAMVLGDIATADPNAYADSLCSDIELKNLAAKISVSADTDISDTQATVTLELACGSVVSADYDLMIALSEEVLSQRLQAKAAHIIGGEKSELLWKHLCNGGSTSSRELHNFY